MLFAHCDCVSPSQSASIVYEASVHEAAVLAVHLLPFHTQHVARLHVVEFVYIEQAVVALSALCVVATTKKAAVQTIAPSLKIDFFTPDEECVLPSCEQQKNFLNFAKKPSAVDAAVFSPLL